MKRGYTIAAALILMFIGIMGCHKNPVVTVPEAPEGAINAVFSVSPEKKVYFSKGNLQYCATTDVWCFAEHQYDTIGKANLNKSPDYEGWIDLFAWGTSGYDHGAVCYQPWSMDENGANYWAYGDSYCNLYDKTGQADWGCNAISNGGNCENYGWRTLTVDEWIFLFHRPTPSGICWAWVKVFGVVGIALLPDQWDASSYSFPLNDPNGLYISVIPDEDWTNILEPAGVVFLPQAGYIGYGLTFGNRGQYWSSSVDEHYDLAYSVYMFSPDFSFGDLIEKNKGCSVRLVYPAE